METNLALNQTWGNADNTTDGGASRQYVPSTYLETVHYYYPMYYSYWTQEDKISKSFKLVQKFIEKKIIKEPKTVKDFIELVNSISEIL